jgi:hypothetical protein
MYFLLRWCGGSSPYHEEPLQCLGMLQTGTARSRWPGWREVTTASGCLRCHLRVPPSLNAPLPFSHHGNIIKSSRLCSLGFWEKKSHVALNLAKREGMKWQFVFARNSHTVSEESIWWWTTCLDYLFFKILSAEPNEIHMLATSWTVILLSSSKSTFTWSTLWPILCVSRYPAHWNLGIFNRAHTTF